MVRAILLSATEGLALLKRRQAELACVLPECAVERFQAVFYSRTGAVVEADKLRMAIEVLFEDNMTAEDREGVNVWLLDLPTQDVLTHSLAGLGAAVATGNIAGDVGQHAIERVRHDLVLRKRQDAEA